ncbi:MAG: ketoacyl-ACP synthase III [Bacteroidales bacterium]|nr:ketoacyl-ACP synthase III [Bacteroidales bacterium]
MKDLNAVITGVASYVPDYILDNNEISTMVDTTDEWIMSRIGIKERRILKEEGVGSSYMGVRAVKSLLEKTATKPEEIELIICSTSTPDFTFPSTAAMIAEGNGIKNAFAYDLSAACSGFLFALETATAFIKAGRYKKVIVVAAEKMSSITNYTDRTTCPLFGDASAAVLVEPTEEHFGVLDSILCTDGVGIPNLQLKAGGSACPASHDTVDNNLHTVYQEGQVVFKYAVSRMSDVSAEIMERNQLTHDDIAWFVPHQANMRIIDAAANRMGLEKEKVMINIQKYGNTSAATLPLCLSEWEPQLKKGDNIILSAFGAGFTWGAIYLKWGYDGK